MIKYLDGAGQQRQQVCFAGMFISQTTQWQNIVNVFTVE